MIVIMVLRAGLSVEAVISSETFTQLVVFCVLAVLGLWFVAWCLAIIGDAVGERRVLGMSIVSRLCFSDPYNLRIVC